MSRTRSPKSVRKSARKSDRGPSAPASFSRLFEVLPQGFYCGTITGNTTKTLATNPHLKLMFGYPTETSSTKVKPFDADRVVDTEAFKIFLERLERDGAVINYLLSLRRVDRTPMWVEVTAHAEPKQGKTLLMHAHMRDVSDKKKSDEQERERSQQVHKEEIKAYARRVMSGVAHEVNNPLATILTWSERLAEQSVDDVVQRGLSTIHSESQRAAGIIRKLSNFSDNRQATQAMVDVNQVIRETMSLRTYQQRVSNIVVIDALASGLPQVWFDAGQLKQVLLNLVINAEHVLEERGRGTLVMRTWYNAGEECVVLELSDDGPGVPDEIQASIFDAFVTTKDVGKGTGLGLTMAQAIMQDHGGRITLTSAPNEGATFRLEFPEFSASTVKAHQTEIPSTKRGTNLGGGAAVLLVEDDPALATVVAEALTDRGYRVDRAGDGKDALSRIAERTYDLVICDLKMPRLDGAAFFRAAVTTTPNLKNRLVFTTGDVVGESTEQFLNEVGCPCLRKPFRLTELFKVAQEVLS